MEEKSVRDTVKEMAVRNPVKEKSVRASGNENQVTKRSINGGLFGLKERNRFACFSHYFPFSLEGTEGVVLYGCTRSEVCRECGIED